GGDPEDAVVSATALELFHNFALIHDDIEDSSEMRRGSQTLHRIHGIPLAINAGDALHGIVHQVLLENHEKLGTQKALQVHHHLNLVMQKTFEGQALDIGWVEKEVFPNREQYQQMIVRKTGWYSGRGPCQCGALIAGKEGELFESLGDFGESLGIGFQIRDDILNLTESSESNAPEAQVGGYGKEQGGDFAEGKRTLITIEMLERLNPEEQNRLQSILLKARTEVKEEEIVWAVEQSERCGALDAARSEAQNHAQRASSELSKMPQGSPRKILEALLGFLAEDRKV
ncbi:MAG: polyprenyl synthetase family protein, partial [SAR324 cluster bacterium]|nr:polyprenyl synthetase family protein [SAR324 cluster bacterium]